jgi:hypothetical protein
MMPNPFTVTAKPVPVPSYEALTFTGDNFDELYEFCDQQFMVTASSDGASEVFQVYCDATTSWQSVAPGSTMLKDEDGRLLSVTAAELEAGYDAATADKGRHLRKTAAV